MTEDRIPPSNISPFALRLQPQVKVALERAAQQNGRSLNAEIASRLEESLQGVSDLETRVATLEKEIARVWSWIAPSSSQVGSGLRERLATAAKERASAALANFREEYGYDDDTLPDPRVTGDAQAFYERVQSDIHASPEEMQHDAQRALDELMEELFPPPAGWITS